MWPTRKVAVALGAALRTKEWQATEKTRNAVPYTPQMRIRVRGVKDAGEEESSKIMSNAKKSKNTNFDFRVSSIFVKVETSEIEKLTSAS